MRWHATDEKRTNCEESKFDSNALEASNLLINAFFRPILPALLAVALSAYGFDCSAMTRPEQAMQCCNSMHCSSHAHHGQDCCKRMPSVRSPFVQPSSAHGMSFPPSLLAVMPPCGELQVLDFSARIIPTHSHAPPIFFSPAPIPIRI